jgi:hypothetical protein
MVTLGSLWLPILLAAVLVFITSFIVHMVLRYHQRDYTRLPNEDAVRAAIRSGNPAAAQYLVPYCSSPKEMQTPEMKLKYAEGPVVVMNLIRAGAPSMGKNLIQWFIFLLIVSLFIAYVAAHSIPTGARYLHVFRIVGAIGFLAYAAGQVTPSIWMGKPWSITGKEVVDGLLYGLVTAGTFGWLWPGR